MLLSLNSNVVTPRKIGSADGEENSNKNRMDKITKKYSINILFKDFRLEKRKKLGKIITEQIVVIYDNRQVHISSKLTTNRD